MLNIEFDLRFIPNYDTPEIRAVMEREGKLWSWRLRDNFDEYVIKEGTVIEPGSEALDEDVKVDDVLIFVHEMELGPNIAWYLASIGKVRTSEDDFRSHLG